MKQRITVYVDESVHTHLGFIITAFVCTKRDLEEPVRKALVDLGFTPGVDEFKSGEQMAGNSRMRELRGRMFQLVVDQTKVVILVNTASSRPSLGSQILHVLPEIMRKNGLDPLTLTVHFDQGLFRSSEEATGIVSTIPDLRTVEFHFEQDSKRVLGLPVADATAHAIAQVLREQVTGRTKRIDIGGDQTGYPDGTRAQLGWSLLMGLRYAFFVRPAVLASRQGSVDFSRDPVLISDEDDPAPPQQHPDLFGWGVLVGDDVTPELRAATEAVFDKIWLGCIH